MTKTKKRASVRKQFSSSATATATAKEQSEHPPQFSSTVQVSRSARYTTNASGTLNLTRAMLLNHLFMTTLTTAQYRMLSGIRLNSIRIWGMSSGGPTLSQVVSCEWTSNYGPTRIVSDNSISTRPAFIKSKPPLNSLASFWSKTGSNETEVLAILIYGTYNIIDISYTCIFQNGETPVLVTSTNAGTIGTVYMSYLDGIAGAGQIPPTSYATLV